MLSVTVSLKLKLYFATVMQGNFRGRFPPSIAYRIMANLFPGVHILKRFLAKTDVGSDTHGRNWLLSLETDVKTVEGLLLTLPEFHTVGGREVATQHFVYSAKRYAETIVFVALQLDCKFARLQRLFGEDVGLLGKIIRQPSFGRVKDFLKGAMGTKLEEWGIFFNTDNTRFCQLLLNNFA